MLRWKFIVVNVNINKQKRFKTSDLNFPLRILDKEEQTEHNAAKKEGNNKDWSGN